MNYSEIPYKEIMLLVLGTLSTFLLWRIQHQKDRIKGIENQLSEKKYKMYSGLIYIIFDLINAPKLGKNITDKEVLKRMLEIKRDMFIYAPDKIFKKYTIWTLALNKPGGNVNHFPIYFDLLKLIRLDMGQSASKIELDDFMLFLMQNEEEYQKFKEMYNW